MSPYRLLYPVLALLFLVFVTHCDLTDTKADELYTHCEETVRVLGSVNEQSSIDGLSSGAELLSRAGGGFSLPAQWSGDTGVLVQSPLEGETVLTVSIAYNGGAIREIDSRLVQGMDEIAMVCQSRLEVDVLLTVVTEDGAFDETWDAILFQSVPLPDGDEALPMLYVEFDLSQLSGHYLIESLFGPEPDWVLGLFASTVGENAQGDVRILLQQTHGAGNEGTVSLSSHIALSWE